MTELIPNKIILGGKYELLAKLGEGGMASVWSAMCTHPSHLPEELVLKVLLPEIRKDKEKRHFFIEEARLSTQLRHPYIVRVFQVEQWNDLDVLIMERIWGEGLDELINKVYLERKENIPWPIALRIGAMVSEALHYANTTTDRHGRRFNVIHRDIKCGNIMLTADGHIKVIDFGIAKASTSQVKTQTGIVKGTIAYMSPEQLKGETLSIRSDLFSVGVVLYELCTGRRPFIGDNFTSLMLGILTKPPIDPWKYNPDIPEAVRDLLIRLLDKNPDNRPVTAMDLQHIIEDLLQDAPGQGSEEALKRYFARYFPDRVKERQQNASLISATTPDGLMDNHPIHNPRGVTLALGELEGGFLLPTGEVIEGTKPIMRSQSSSDSLSSETEFIEAPKTPSPFPAVDSETLSKPRKTSTSDQIQRNAVSLQSERNIATHDLEARPTTPLPETQMYSLLDEGSKTKRNSFIAVGALLLVGVFGAVLWSQNPSPKKTVGSVRTTPIIRAVAPISKTKERTVVQRRVTPRTPVQHRLKPSITRKPKRVRTKRKKTQRIRRVHSRKRRRVRVAKLVKRPTRIEQGEASIRLTPPCQLHYKGRKLGRTQTFIRFKAKPGHHTLQCINHQHKFTYNLRVALASGTKITINRTLRKGHVSFITRPFSRVFLKQRGTHPQNLGTTPIHTKLYEGVYTVVLIHGQNSSLRMTKKLRVRPRKKLRFKKIWK